MVGQTPPARDHAILEDHVQLTRTQREALKLIRGAAVYRGRGGYRGRGTGLISLKTYKALRLHRLVEANAGRCFLTHHGQVWLAQEGKGI